MNRKHLGGESRFYDGAVYCHGSAGPPRLLWSGAAALAGSCLLNVPEGGIQKGDFLLLICAIMYAMHILTIDYFAPKTDCVRMACFQFLGCGVLSTVLSLILGESWAISRLCAVAVPLLYCGVAEIEVKNRIFFQSCGLS